VDEFGALVDLGATGESYYLQGAYRLSPAWEVFVRYDALFADKDDRIGEDFEEQTGLPAHSRFAKDWTAGLGWTIGSSFLLRAEYHNIDGTGWLPIADNPDASTTDRYWDMFLLQASYRF
jgi:phosphate-selective porin